MAALGFDLVFKFIFIVLGIVVLLGGLIALLFVILRRRERDEAVERTFTDHAYADYPANPQAPPTPPGTPTE